MGTPEIESRPMLPTVDARIYPRGGLDVLSRARVARLRRRSTGGRVTGPVVTVPTVMVTTPAPVT